jgi:hypothetical protein
VVARNSPLLRGIMPEQPRSSRRWPWLLLVAFVLGGALGAAAYTYHVAIVRAVAAFRAAPRAPMAR